MLDPNFILLYVEHPENSAALYAKLLDRQPVDASPTFVMFALDSGMRLGLWGREGVEPAAQRSTDARGELAFAVADNATVLQRHADLSALGLTILQEPVQLDFGFTFVAADLDGHRLRVFAPGGE
ncbi:MAG: VOC family protein [Gammaproteobacteria bacterium]